MITSRDEIERNCYDIYDLPYKSVDFPQLAEEIFKGTKLKVKEFRHFTKICLKIPLRSSPDYKRDSIFYEIDTSASISLAFLEYYFLGAVRKILNGQIGDEKTEEFFKIYLETVSPVYKKVFAPIFQNGTVASSLCEEAKIHQIVKNHIPRRDMGKYLFLKAIPKQGSS